MCCSPEREGARLRALKCLICSYEEVYIFKQVADVAFLLFDSFQVCIVVDDYPLGQACDDLGFTTFSLDDPRVVWLGSNLLFNFLLLRCAYHFPPFIDLISFVLQLELDHHRVGVLAVVLREDEHEAVATNIVDFLCKVSQIPFLFLDFKRSSWFLVFVRFNIFTVNIVNVIIIQSLIIELKADFL